MSGNETMQILLSIHILAGTIALFCAAMAVSSEKGKKLHLLSGRTYFWCMVAIFLTAIPMSIITSNIFLFLIAFFSFYLAFSGIRFARNRKGIATTLDWIAVGQGASINSLIRRFTLSGASSGGQCLTPGRTSIRRSFA